MDLKINFIFETSVRTRLMKLGMHIQNTDHDKHTKFLLSMHFATPPLHSLTRCCSISNLLSVGAFHWLCTFMDPSIKMFDFLYGLESWKLADIFIIIITIRTPNFSSLSTLQPLPFALWHVHVVQYSNLVWVHSCIDCAYGLRGRRFRFLRLPHGLESRNLADILVPLVTIITPNFSTLGTLEPLPFAPFHGLVGPCFDTWKQHYFYQLPLLRFI